MVDCSSQQQMPMAHSTPQSPTSSEHEAVTQSIHNLLQSLHTTRKSHAPQLHGQVDCLSHTTQLHSSDVAALVQFAIENGSTQLLSALLKSQSRTHSNSIANFISGDQLLRRIVQEGNADLARVLLSHNNSNTSVIDPANASQLLLLAVEQDNVDMARVLLQDGGVDANACDQELHCTALHSAVEWDSVAIQKLLIQAGADVNAITNDGWTPLHLGVHHGHMPSVAFLVQNGAHVDATDATGATPLHIAARDGHTNVVTFLLANGANVKARDADGRTALHVAAFYDESAARFASGESDTQLAVLKTLLAHGANVNVRDHNGDSALHVAQRGGFELIVDLLLLAQHHRHEQQQ